MRALLPLAPGQAAAPMTANHRYASGGTLDDHDPVAGPIGMKANLPGRKVLGQAQDGVKTSTSRIFVHAGDRVVAHGRQPVSLLANDRPVHCTPQGPGTE